MNRATADNQSAQAEDEGLEPTKEWVKDLIDEIIAAAGNPDGGQWTEGSLGQSATNLAIRARATLSGKSTQRAQYAEVELQTRSDATNVPDGVQYAADPSRYSIEPSARTGISQIDDTTEKLLNTLVDASDKLGLLPAIPQLYGILLHMQFAADVEAANIYGISPDDVERTFALPAGYPSDKKSVKPDVVLRNDSGDIIAIYDVKTGEKGIEPWRANELRAATGVDDTVPIIELVLYEES